MLHGPTHNHINKILNNIGVPHIIIPIEWDEKELYVEKEIPEEIDLINSI